MYDHMLAGVNEKFRATPGIDKPEVSAAVQWRRRSALPDDIPAFVQLVITSVQDFCHCSATCIQNCMGFVAPMWKASAPGQLPSELEPGLDVSFCSTADGEAVVGLGNLSCSSQASIM